MSESGPAPVPTAVDRLLAALDAVIALVVILVLVYLVAGGIDLGVLTVNRLSKPFLVLLLLASLRAAVPRASRLTLLVGHARSRLAAALDGASGRGPWGAAALDAAFAVLAVHVVTKLTAFYATALYPLARERNTAIPFEARKLAETFAAWDSGWYLEIARRGRFVNTEGQDAIAFFPLYPMLMRALAWPFGGSERALWIAGIALSYACFFLGLVVLHRFTTERFADREAARRTVLYVAVFPFAFFFTQIYAESLFLLLSVSAVAAASASRFGLAGALGLLVALTRPNGVLIGIPLGLLALRGRPRPLELVRRSATVALVPLGLAAYSAFAWRVTGDPLGWLHAQDGWGYSLGHPPWVELMRMLDGLERQGFYAYFFSEELAPYRLLHGAVALAVIALLPSVFARLGLALGAYVAATLYVPLTANALEGIGRYAATLFPVFMLLGAATSKRLHEALLVIGSLLLSLLASLFATMHPVY